MPFFYILEVALAFIFSHLRKSTQVKSKIRKYFLASNRYADKRMQAQLAGCEKMFKNVNITNFKILKT